MATIIAKGVVKRKPGYLYFIDKNGNVAEAQMKKGGTKGAKRKACTTATPKKRKPAAKKTATKKTATKKATTMRKATAKKAAPKRKVAAKKVVRKAAPKRKKFLGIF